MVYTPLWFKIKRNHTISHALLHVFDNLFKCQKLPSQVREFVIPVIERNAFGAHHESILVAMVSRTYLNHNKVAWRRILRSREQNVSDGRIRQLYESLSLISMPTVTLISLTGLMQFFRAIFYCFCDEQPSNKIKEIIKSKTFSEFKIAELSWHTQSVERHIKLVSEASYLVCDHASKKGLIRNKLSSRATMPCFNTKSQNKTLKINASA